MASEPDAAPKAAILAACDDAGIGLDPANRVTEIAKRSPCLAAGLQVGDTIVSWQGQRLGGGGEGGGGAPTLLLAAIYKPAPVHVLVVVCRMPWSSIPRPTHPHNTAQRPVCSSYSRVPSRPMPK